ncbi:MAG: N-acetyltransferase family protein [Methylovirgula sp.]
MPDFSTFYLKTKLDDGTPATLRAVHRDDGPRIRRAFHTLGSETIHARFFEYRAEVTEAELAHITGVDFKRDAALLVTTGAGADEVIIGGVSYFAIDDADPPKSAELAFTIIDGYQGHGIGRLLMHEIIEIARANGIEFLEADMFADNTPMLHVFQHAGPPLTLLREEDTIHVRLELKAGLSLR